MGKIAVDVVLLLSQEMASQAIEANKRLLKQHTDQIILNHQNCLPHISLAMGCMDDRDVVNIGEILHKIAKRNNPGKLHILGINIGSDSIGETVSSFEVRKTEKLLSLHKTIMQEIEPYFSYDVTTQMLLSPPVAGEATLSWIENYPEKSAFENFFPHITIGYGQSIKLSFTAVFTASKLALCHLGNYCTCRKILASVDLGN